MAPTILHIRPLRKDKSKLKRSKPSTFIISAHRQPFATFVVVMMMMIRAAFGAHAFISDTRMMISLTRRRTPRLSRAQSFSYSSFSSYSMRRDDEDALLQDKKTCKNKKKIAVIGGGLAGLSTVYHLLDKTTINRRQEGVTTIDRITIWDRAPVGKAGASSVAGGLVHPLSPRGKLVHWGMQGLEATRRLVDVACQAAERRHAVQQEDDDDDNLQEVVLRREILRLALTPQHVEQLKATAEQDFAGVNNTKSSSNEDDDASVFSCEWLDADEISRRYHLLNEPNDDHSDEDEKFIRGGLLLSGGGCQVLHVPSYLQALWLACRDIGKSGGVELKWKLVKSDASNRDDDDDGDDDDWGQRLAHYDTIVLAGGNGMFGDLIPSNDALPVHLVRGQSVEMDVPSSIHPFVDNEQQPALLCGKYVSPLPSSTRDDGRSHILIGATHEFKADPMSPDEVTSFLRQATAPILPPTLWPQEDNTDDDNEGGRGLKITTGFRVQSQRGKYGRMPIIGRYRGEYYGQHDGKGNESTPARESSTSMSWCRQDHQDAWIFTGLSSRGLLHHALYGDILTDAILANDDEQVLLDKCPDLLWWKKDEAMKEAMNE